MKVVCDGCSAKYIVPDEGSKRAIRLTCQKCGKVLTVRRDSHAEAGAAELRKRLGLGGAQGQKAKVKPGAPADWYFSREGQSFGPFTLKALVARFESQELGPECYVWHRELGDWLPAHSTAPFDSVIERLHPVEEPEPDPTALLSKEASDEAVQERRSPGAKVQGLRATLEELEESSLGDDDVTMVSAIVSEQETGKETESGEVLQSADIIESGETLPPSDALGVVDVSLNTADGEKEHEGAEAEPSEDEEFAEEGIDLDIDGASRVLDMKALMGTAGRAWEPEKKDKTPAPEEKPERTSEEVRAELFASIEAMRKEAPEDFSGEEPPVERSMLIHIDHLKQQNRKVRFYAIGAVSALVVVALVIWVVIAATETDLEGEGQWEPGAAMSSISGTEINDKELEKLAPLAEFSLVEAEPEESSPVESKKKTSKKRSGDKKKRNGHKKKGSGVEDVVASVEVDTDFSGQELTGLSKQGIALEGESGPGLAKHESKTSFPSHSGVAGSRRTSVSLSEEEGVGKVMNSGRSKYATKSGKVKSADRNQFVSGLKKVSKAVQECHKRQLKNGTSIAPKVYITLTVEPEGKVSKIRIDKAFKGSTFEKCLLSKSDRWKFKAFEGKAVDLRQGFVLE